MLDMWEWEEIKIASASSMVASVDAWSTGCSCGLEGESSFTLLLTVVCACLIVYVIHLFVQFVYHSWRLTAPVPSVTPVPQPASASVRDDATEQEAGDSSHFGERQGKTVEKTVYVLAPQIYMCALDKQHVYHCSKLCNGLVAAKTITEVPVCKICKKDCKSWTTVRKLE